MKVLKFGGTSVGSIPALTSLAAIVAERKNNGEEIAIVCSAFSKVTDTLLTLSATAANRENYTPILTELRERHIAVVQHFIKKEKETVTTVVDELIDELAGICKGISLLRQLPLQTKDMVVAFGEKLSNTIVAAILHENGIAAYFTDASTLIKTDSNFGNAKYFRKETYTNIANHIAANKSKGIAVITGFIGSDKNGNITTLGRGGSDLTASIVGAALQATVVEIWTDVDGMLTADPRKVPAAFSIPALSYKEAMELSHFGAKVIYPPSLQPAMAEGIPILIKNTFQPSHSGSLITKNSPASDSIIRGISSLSQIALVRIEGAALMGTIGMMGRVSKALAAHKVNIIFLTQGSSEYSICLGISPMDIETTQMALNAEFEYELQQETMLPFLIDSSKTLLAVIGENMRQSPGVASRVFKALGNNGINIAAIAQGSSELNISIVVDDVHEVKALNALHEVFFKEDVFKLNIFLVGYTGLIGKTLLSQIKEHQSFLRESKNIEIVLIGATNSKQQLIDKHGLDIDQLGDTVSAKGIPTDAAAFIAEILALDLPNSVLVDCSANATFVPYYSQLLSESVAVVTPNKTANSQSQQEYETLRNAAKKGNTHFCYETNVGAGLPVISTLHNLLNSGDKIEKIEAVLSGTLSYIFNNFTAEKTYTDIVKEAQAKGYTEPDPRDDLSGLDVARKCLILARETGAKLELADITIESLVPEACRDAKTVEEFYAILPQHEEAIIHLKNEAIAQDKKLRYIATIENGKAKVSLQMVAISHPFYALSGSDNMMVFTTTRYSANPLVVRGPGAGAAVTAAGVFAEVVALARFD